MAQERPRIGGSDFLVQKFGLTQADIVGIRLWNESANEKLRVICAFSTERYCKLRPSLLATYGRDEVKKDLASALFVYARADYLVEHPFTSPSDLVRAVDRHANTISQRECRHARKNAPFDPDVHGTSTTPPEFEREGTADHESVIRKLVFAALPKLGDHWRTQILAIFNQHRQPLAEKNVDGASDHAPLTPRLVSAMVKAILSAIDELLACKENPRDESQALRALRATLARWPGRGSRTRHTFCQYVLRHLTNMTSDDTDHLTHRGASRHAPSAVSQPSTPLERHNHIRSRVPPPSSEPAVAPELCQVSD